MSLKRKLFRKKSQNLRLVKEGEKRRRVLIGVPLLDTIYPETSTSITNLCLTSLTSGYDVSYRFKQSANVHTNRNACVRGAYEINATHLMFIDSDMVFPDGVKGNQPNIIEQLLAHDKDIIGALCVRKKSPCLPCIANWDEERQYYVNILDWPEDALIEVDGIGTGILLIKTRVFDKISEVFFKDIPFKDHGWFSAVNIQRGDTVKELGTDYSFSYRARQAGYKIYCDTSIPIGHLGRWTYTLNDYMAMQDQVIKHNEETAADTVPFNKGRLAEGVVERPSVWERLSSNCQEAGK